MATLCRIGQNYFVGTACPGLCCEIVISRRDRCIVRCGIIRSVVAVLTIGELELNLADSLAGCNSQRVATIHTHGTARIIVSRSRSTTGLGEGQCCIAQSDGLPIEALAIFVTHRGECDTIAFNAGTARIVGQVAWVSSPIQAYEIVVVLEFKSAVVNRELTANDYFIASLQVVFAGEFTLLKAQSAVNIEGVGAVSLVGNVVTEATISAIESGHISDDTLHIVLFACVVKTIVFCVSLGDSSHIPRISHGTITLGRSCRVWCWCIVCLFSVNFYNLAILCHLVFALIRTQRAENDYFITHFNLVVRGKVLTTKIETIIDVELVGILAIVRNVVLCTGVLAGVQRANLRNDALDVNFTRRYIPFTDKSLHFGHIVGVVLRAATHGGRSFARFSSLSV